jgi:hypothetical protein
MSLAAGFRAVFASSAGGVAPSFRINLIIADVLYRAKNTQ